MHANKHQLLTGAVPIIPIPFCADDEIDEESLRRLVEFSIARGLSAICLPAYGSEFYKLSDEERVRVVKIAVQKAAGRIKVIAQSNHASSRVALATARKHVENGADIISVALPRHFALSEDDLLGYVTPILNGVPVPCLVQDFNPGGATVGVGFVTRLRAECPTFQYLKLEEPLMAKKVAALREATNDGVGILEGWGGMYLMELIPAGIRGVMPGLAIADTLDLVFKWRVANRTAEAFELYEKLLPLISYSLQNFELWLYCEKRLLQARGLLPNTRCRTASFTPDPHTLRYVEELVERVIKALADAALPGIVAPESARAKI